jgi:hypothetical protein
MTDLVESLIAELASTDLVSRNEAVSRLSDLGEAARPAVPR